MFDVCELLAAAVRLASSGKTVALNESQRRAVNLLRDMLRGREQLGAVQGPPGTGKTSVVEEFARSDMSNFVAEKVDEVVVYIAPTNMLAAHAFTRVAAQLLQAGVQLSEIVSFTRLYGSKFYVRREGCRLLEKVAKAAGYEAVPSERSIKEMVHGGLDPLVVRIVFSTEYQRVSGRFTRLPSALHLVVDEASKSPYYRAFIAIADAVARGRYPASMVALGDPEQAITIPEAFKVYRVPLLMEKIMRMLVSSGRSNLYVFLDTTYRMPGPSEEPISYGFYDGRLRAYESAKWRLRGLEQLFEDARSRAWNLLRSVVSPDTLLERLFDAVYEAVTSKKPVVIVETREFKPDTWKISTFDGRRASIAAKAAMVLQAFHKAVMETSGQLFETLVTAPYSDMVLNVQYRLADRLPAARIPVPRAATVQAVIGGEADAVVAVLGKERPARRSGYWMGGDQYETMYFNEPQVLNVQLSRHSKLLVVVGSTRRLSEQQGRGPAFKLRRTSERLRELAERGDAVLVDATRL